MKRYPWEAWQEQFVIDNYETMSPGRIGRFLNRTALAVRLKYHRSKKLCFKHVDENQMPISQSM